MLDIVIAGVDGGQGGGIALPETYLMPIATKEVKPNFYQVEKVKVGKKTTIRRYKSGEKKGQPVTKILHKKEVEKYIDVATLKALLDSVNVVVLEKPGLSHNASSLRSQTSNIEAVKVVCRLLDIKVIEVAADRWKKYFKLSDDKYDAMVLAEKLSGLNFSINHDTKKGKDGEAEAWLIREWFIRFYKSLRVGNKYKYYQTSTKKSEDGKKSKKYTATATLELVNLLPEFLAEVRTSHGLTMVVRVEDLYKKDSSNDR